ncbi:hypothetical protein K491DRAFT_686761 [Lophiostoma macrostomum CBS 122681]|uniref:Voltage-gated hydrogen channel 1 n=1 Tax=Lophiostoma macrostomum CBS 122681 TaxID=1314788 RepID=A0A6A6TTN5_9PLEO|nr:hypothetical protein K491DRAFT_686761 [Lophiostoma macrostomum CBS 122681]
MSSSPLLPASERDESLPNSNSYFPIPSIRRQLFRFLDSKTFHYSILALVSLDVSCLFADIVINLLTCGHRTKPYDDALRALEIISLVFSCLFVLELIATLWAFGTSYFKSKFHIFDAAIIITSFIVEVTLQGVTEEVASLIVILRLFRVVKIVDELGVAADEQMKEMESRIEDLEKENEGLRGEIRRLKAEDET